MIQVLRGKRHWPTTGIRFGLIALVILAAGVAVGASVAFATGTGRPAPEDVVNEPVQTSAEFTVVEGATPGGEPWSLVAYESNRGLCVELRGVARANEGSANCVFDVPSKHSVSLNTQTFAEPAVTVVYGPLASTVRTVSATLSDGRVLALPAIKSPAGLGFEGRFYASLLPRGLAVSSIKGTSALGVTVEKRTG
jgi:hypothetical protein